MTNIIGFINDNRKADPDSLYFQAKYFYSLRNFILKNGRIEKVNASSRIDKLMYIVYHIISFESVELTVDKTDRIYFSNPKKENRHLGNILMEDNKFVRVEAEDSSDSKLVYKVYCGILSKIEKIKK
jgi:hypothetical protein